MAQLRLIYLVYLVQEKNLQQMFQIQDMAG